MRHLIAIILVIFISGCSEKYTPLPTVEKVDIQKYKGTWYEIARFEHFFEKGCKNVTATYELNSDNSIKVLNKCEMIEDGQKKEAEGIAYVTNKSGSKLEVSFFRPFYGDYWILELDRDYKYALVGTPSREYLWILARSKTIDDEIKQDLVQKAVELGFDKSKLIWTIQE